MIRGLSNFCQPEHGSYYIEHSLQILFLAAIAWAFPKLSLFKVQNVYFYIKPKNHEKSPLDTASFIAFS